MRHRYKAKYDQVLKETRVAYFNVSDFHGFRLAYMKVYLEAYDECILSINTNLTDKKVDTTEYTRTCETYLEERGFEYRILPIANTRDKKVFGFKIGTEQEKAFVILLKLSTKDFDQDFYDHILKRSDYMIGLKLDQTFEALVQDFQKGYEEYLYEVKGFERVLYDSVLIKSVRTNFDYFPEVDY